VTGIAWDAICTCRPSYTTTCINTKSYWRAPIVRGYWFSSCSSS